MRQSEFELLRIIAMFMIVFYHLLLFSVSRCSDDTIYQAMMLPLHIGVHLFVLISGYFGINSTIRGGVRLLTKIAVYAIPINVAIHLIEGQGFSTIVKDFLIISHTPYWFMATYFYLYLCAPILNFCFEKLNVRRLYYLIGVLGFLSFYLGVLGKDESLCGGKNIVNFAFLYMVGRMIYKYRTIWHHFSYWKLIIIYLSLNGIVVGLYLLNNPSIIMVLWNAMYYYCSIGLLFNAILVFFIVGKKTFRSSIINGIGGSVFAIYLIHGNPHVYRCWIHPFACSLYDKAESVPMVFICMCLLTILIMTGSVLVDKLLYPIWTLNTRFAETIESRVKTIVNEGRIHC